MKVFCVYLPIPVLLSICLPLLVYFEFHLHGEIWLWLDKPCAFCDKAQAIIACACGNTCTISDTVVLVQAKNRSHKSSTGRVTFNSIKMPSSSSKL